MRRTAVYPWLPAVTAAVAVFLVCSLVAPAPASAQLPGVDLGLPDLTPDLGIPGPSDLAAKVFEYFFKTFFGIEAKVTRRVVEWLVAAPVYTDSARFSELNELRTSVSIAAWALFTLVFTVSAVRYYASGFTSGGSYEAVEALSRGGLAAGALAIYPVAFGDLTIATNQLTYGLIHGPNVDSGITKVLAAATASNLTPLGIGTLAAVVAVVLLLTLLVTKIVIATLLALLYVSAPIVIALWPLPETSWLARTWFQSLVGLLLWPVVWAMCFAIFAVMGDSAFTLKGSFGDELIKPWVAVAALFVSFKAPQLLARQAMLAGLAPSPGNAAARGLMYGRMATRAGRASAQGVSGRFTGAASGGAG